MSGFHARRNPGLDVSHQFLGVELNVVQYFRHGFSIDNPVYLIAVFVDGDMNGIGVAEQVVHVAKYLLICPHEEHSQIIWLSRMDVVNRQGVGCAVVGYEVGYFAV